MYDTQMFFRKVRMEHFRFSIFFLIFLLALSSAAAQWGEEDLDRIFLLSEKGANRFYVFKGMDESDHPLFEPLSGARTSRQLPEVLPTKYYRETPPYEIALDTFRYYQDINWTKAAGSKVWKEYFWRIELLRVLGRIDLVESLQKQYEIQTRIFEHFLEMRKNCRTIWVEGKEAIRKQKEKPVCSYQPAVNTTTLENDLIKNLEAEIERKGKRISRELSNNRVEVEKLLNERNIPAAAALCRNMRNFYWQFFYPRSRKTFVWKEKDLFEARQKEIRESMEECETLILQKLREKFRDQGDFKELKQPFQARFPKARGLWSESAPVSSRDLQLFMQRFYEIRDEETEYSPITAFEKWGTCRLSILLFTSGLSGAKYLEDEFRNEFRKRR